MPRSVALVGFADNYKLVYRSQADEVWSLNHAFKLDLPRMDRLFEVHPWELLTHPSQRNKEYLNWLSRTIMPVYMLKKDPRVPASVTYPFNEVCEEFLSTVIRRDYLTKEDVVNLYFTSSFCYMMGLALLEGFESIEVIGFEMAWETEYRYQRDGAAYWLGIASGRKAEVILPRGCSLLKGRLYGYEGLHMITRQKLEGYRLRYHETYLAKIGGLNQLSGQWNDYTSRNGNAQTAEAQELWKRIQAATEEVHVYSGALQAVDKLIAECDMQEVDPDLGEAVKEIELEQEA